MASQDEDLDLVSNLTITDHLPSDIVRSLWTIQSLNMKLQDKKKALHWKLNILKLMGKVVSESTAGAKTKDVGVQGLNLYRIKLFQKIKQINNQAEKLLDESILEATKLRLFLDHASKYLYGYNCELVDSVIFLDRSPFQLKQFTDVLDKLSAPKISKLLLREFGFPATVLVGSFDKVIKENQCFYHHSESPCLVFSGKEDEFRDLIEDCSEKWNKISLKNDISYYNRSQRIFALLCQNEQYDKFNYLNGHTKPKVKLIIKNPRFNKLSHESSSESETPVTPRLKLTIKGSSANGAASPKFQLPTVASPKAVVQEGLAPDVNNSNVSSRVRRANTVSQPVTQVVKPVAIAPTNAVKEEEVYCVCRTGSTGKMIACDDRKCNYVWYHYKCLGLSSSFEPAKSEKWYCPECAVRHAATPIPNVPVSQSNGAKKLTSLVVKKRQKKVYLAKERQLRSTESANPKNSTELTTKTDMPSQKTSLTSLLIPNKSKVETAPYKRRRITRHSNKPDVFAQRQIVETFIQDGSQSPLSELDYD